MSYEQHKARANERQRQQVAKGQDIGDIPPVDNSRRRGSTRRSFRLFCETYFPETFCKAWSEDHLKVIGKIEKVTLDGGLFALAMPRGSGKTVLCWVAVLWSILHGHRRYACLLACNKDRATDLIDTVQQAIRFNTKLAADFPRELCPLVKLEGEPRRCKGQRYKGEPTGPVWSADKLVFPNIPGSKASGAIITGAGLTGGDVRGQQHILPDGQTVIRPDLVVPDDPQTDETANSELETRRRVELLNGAVLGMAGPGKKIAALMACTVIQPDDMAEQMLDREKSPEWHGERMKMLYADPSNGELWDEYATIRRLEFLNDGTGSEATEFYRTHQDDMDAGAVAAWPERYYEDELSAVQHAMNLRFRNETAFFAEYQNEPLVDDQTSEQLDKAEIEKKVNGYKRGQVPADVTQMTAFADVHDNLVYWMVCGWTPQFSGYVIDYGTWPEQKRAHFYLHAARPTMKQKHPGKGIEGAVHAGLEAYIADVVDREWAATTGSFLRITKAPIDHGYLSHIVESVIRSSRHRAVLLPAKGVGLRVTNKPFSEYRKHRGDRAGVHWRMPAAKGGMMPLLQIDTNYWKSFARERLATPKGERGCLSLFSARTHRLLAEHLTAERFDRVSSNGRTIDQWTLPKRRPDNHWWDCLVGNCVAASMLGVALPGTERPATRRKQTRRQKVSYM